MDSGYTLTHRTMRLDLTTVERVRVQAGLPVGVSTGAVVRYALALAAGVDTAAALDSTPGRGAVSYRAKGRVA